MTRDLELDVPPGATTHECPRCGEAFASERARDLHLGLVHDDLTDDEREAVAAAREDERRALHRFRILALGVLVLLYFGFLFLFAGGLEGSAASASVAVAVSAGRPPASRKTCVTSGGNYLARTRGGTGDG